MAQQPTYKKEKLYVERETLAGNYAAGGTDKVFSELRSIKEAVATVEYPGSQAYDWKIRITAITENTITYELDTHKNDVGAAGDGTPWAEMGVASQVGIYIHWTVYGYE